MKTQPFGRWPVIALLLSLGMAELVTAPAATAQEKFVVKPLAEKKLNQLPAGPLYWRIENFATLAQAQAAAGPASLAERIRAHEQHKARLAEQEAKLRDAERKVRTRRLIQAGGLIDKAGLLDLESNALYGALLSLRDGLGDSEQVGRWAALGGRAFAREARLEDEGKEAIILAFRTALARDSTTALRAAGFRLQHWEGRARVADAEALANSHGGALRRIAAAVPSTPPAGQAAE